MILKNKSLFHNNVFENQKELNNKENEINNKILDIIKMNKKINAGKKKKPQKNSVINDIIKFKKFDSEKDKNKLETNIIKGNDNLK